MGRWLPTPLLLVLGASLATLACGQDRTELLSPDGASARSATGEAHAEVTFRAHLTGDQEVPAVDTRAQGQAQFWLSDDGSELRYRLNVANIEDVLMSHIHMAAAGVNGPVVAWLYPPGPPPQLIPGRFSGVLATGVVTDAQLTGPLAGMTLADLLAAMSAGDTYVNVHTTANPGGEVRGQISR
jgi:hypothetical protein